MAVPAVHDLSVFLEPMSALYHRPRGLCAAGLSAHCRRAGAAASGSISVPKTAAHGASALPALARATVEPGAAGVAFKSRAEDDLTRRGFKAPTMNSKLRFLLRKDMATVPMGGGMRGRVKRVR